MKMNRELQAFLKAARKRKPGIILSRAAWALAVEIAGIGSDEAETLRAILFSGAREVFGGQEPQPQLVTEIWALHMPIGSGAPVEIPLEQWTRGFGTSAGASLRERSAEIAPGVRVVLVQTGQSVLPDGTVGTGAQIVVWRETEKEAE